MALVSVPCCAMQLLDMTDLLSGPDPEMVALAREEHEALQLKVCMAGSL